MSVAYILWFFLGGLGGHRFYLGKTGSAVGLLILTLITAVFTFGILQLSGSLSMLVLFRG